MPHIRSRAARPLIPVGSPQWNPRFPRPVLVWTPHLHDLVSGVGFAQVAPSTHDVFQAVDFGVAREFKGGTAYSIPLTVLPYFTPPATVLVLWRQSSNANQPFFSFGGSGAGNGWTVSATTSAYRMTYGGVADYTTSATYNQNRSHAVAFAIGPVTTNFDLIEDGIYRGTTAAGGTPGAPTAKATVAATNEGTATLAQCYLGLVAVWNRQLPRGMLCELTLRPDLLFTQRRASLFLAPTAGAFNPAWAIAANSTIQPGAIAA
jgi:hypothetical protein